jgi:hypothetical protein
MASALGTELIPRRLDCNRDNPGHAILKCRQPSNALAELGIVCSLSCGRIVANPDITPVLG